MEIREYGPFRAEEILPLYDSVGWTNYTRQPDMLKNAYAHSLLTLGAYEGDRLLGVLRCVGDGYSVVFIQDILVFPDCQRKGVGRALLNAALERYSGVYQIQLLTDDTPATTAFYEALGFFRADRMGCVSFVKMKG